MKESDIRGGRIYKVRNGRGKISRAYVAAIHLDGNGKSYVFAEPPDKSAHGRWVLLTTFARWAEEEVSSKPVQNT